MTDDRPPKPIAKRGGYQPRAAGPPPTKPPPKPVWPSAQTDVATRLADIALALTDRLEESEARVSALTRALEEACDWLDNDLAGAPEDTSTAMADRELVASWRAALAGDDQSRRRNDRQQFHDRRCKCGLVIE